MVSHFIPKSNVSKINLVTSQARVWNLSKSWNDDQPLGPEHRLFYRIEGSNHFGKLDDGLTGMLPQAAWKKSYSGSTRTADDDIILGDVFVYDITDRPEIGNEDADNAIRGYINSCYGARSITFCANVPKGKFKKSWNSTERKYNGEALVKFVPDSDINTLVKLVRQWLGQAEHFECKRAIDWNYIYEQQEDVIELMGILMRTNTALYSAYTSRGKTLISLATAARMFPNGGIVLVTTSIVDTLRSFHEEASGKYLSDNRQQKVTPLLAADFKAEVKKHGIEGLRARAAAGELFIILLSIQDLRWDDSSEESVTDEVVELREAYRMLSGNVDLWVRDEIHKEYGGVVTKARMAHLIADKYLDLTATAYTIMSDYTDGNYLIRTLLWGLQHAEANRLPKLGIRIRGIGEAVSAISPKFAGIYSAAEGYDPRKYVAVSDGHFVMAQALLDLRNAMYFDPRSPQKNPIGVACTNSNGTQCGMVVCPDGTGEYGSAVYLPMLAKLWNSGLDIKDTLFIDAYELEKIANSRNISINDYVVELMASYRRVIILTCGKFLTGTNIKPLDHVVLIDSMKSISNFEQLVGRMVREWDGKDVVTLYSFMPNQDIKLLYSRWTGHASKITGVTQKEFYDVLPLTLYDIDTSKMVTPAFENIVQTFQEYAMDKASRGLPSQTVSGELETVDFDMSNEAKDMAKKFKKADASPTESLGGKSGAKVSQKKPSTNPKTNKPYTKEEWDDHQLAIVLLQQSAKYAPIFAVGHDNYSVDYVYALPEMDDLLTVAVMKLIRNIIGQNSELKRSIQENLNDKRVAFQNLPFNDVCDEIFKNDKFLKDQNLVFITNVAAEYFCTTLNIPEDFDGSIVVGNALSGSVPFHLKKLFPRATIYCREYFPYFKSHLERMGFTVFTTDEEVLEMAMTEEAKGKPFDYGFINPPYMKGKWKKFITDLHSRIDVQLVTVSPDPTEGIGKDTDEWIKKSESMGIQTRIDATKYFPTVESGKISLCSYMVGSTHNPAALTRENPLEAAIINKLTIEDSERTCVRGSYSFMTPKVEGVKRNKNKDILPNSELPNSTMTQPVVISVGKTKLDQRYFKDLVKNQSTIIGDGFVFNRSFGVDSNSPVYKVSNSNSLGLTNNVLWHDAKHNETVESFKSVFGSKLYRYFFKKVKNGALDVQARLFTSLRCPDLTKVYTDDELYALNGIVKGTPDGDAMIAEVEANYE